MAHDEHTTNSGGAPSAEGDLIVWDLPEEGGPHADDLPGTGAPASDLLIPDHLWTGRPPAVLLETRVAAPEAAGKEMRPGRWRGGRRAGFLAAGVVALLGLSAVTFQAWRPSVELRSASTPTTTIGTSAVGTPATTVPASPVGTTVVAVPPATPAPPPAAGPEAGSAPNQVTPTSTGAGAGAGPATPVPAAAPEQPPPTAPAATAAPADPPAPEPVPTTALVSSPPPETIPLTRRPRAGDEEPTSTTTVTTTTTLFPPDVGDAVPEPDPAGPL